MTGNERPLVHEQVRVARELAESNGLRVNFSGSTLGLASEHVLPEANPASR